MDNHFVLYKNDRTYRGKSALEVVMKPSMPELSEDGKIQDWREGKLILSFYPRADMKAPIELDGRISLAMSFREMFKLFFHYSSGAGNGPEKVEFVHKSPGPNGQELTKKLVGNWYSTGDRDPVYNITAWQGEGRITVMLGYEEMCIIKELNRICLEESYVYREF